MEWHKKETRSYQQPSQIFKYDGNNFFGVVIKRSPITRGL